MKKIVLSLIATLALADSIDDGISHLNSIRSSVGLNEFTINSILQNSSYNHSLYLVTNNEAGHYENSANPNFTGNTPQDRMVNAGYNNYATSENISFGSKSYVHAIDSLMTAIYHRFGFLDFGMDEVGFDKYEDENYYYKNVYTFNMGNSNIVNVCNSTYNFEYGNYYMPCVNTELKVPAENYDEAVHKLKIANPKVITYPYSGQLDFIPVFDDTETPDPTPTLGVSGNPISIQFNDYYVNSVTLNDFKLYDSSDNEIEISTLTSKSDPNEKLTSHDFVIFPIKRLEWNSYYRVKASFSVDGEEFLKEFTFKTKSIDYPLIKATQNDETLNIEANKEYLVSIDSNLAEKVDAFSSKFYDKCDVEIFDINTLKLSANNTCIVTIANSIINFKIVEDDGLIDINDTQITLPPENPEEKVTLNIAKGWNLLSLPIDVKSYEASNLGSYSALWSYVDGKWNENTSMLNSSIGFWIKSNETTEIEFSGSAYSPELTSLNDEWNLVGTGEKLENLSATAIWKYNQTNGWVSNPTAIEAGEGFWIKK